MKRSVNFSYTRKRRNPLTDMALFLQDLGLPKDEIIKAVTEAQAKVAETEVAEIEKEIKQAN